MNSILKFFFEFAKIFTSIDHSPLSPKARSIAERCHRKRKVKFSIVLEMALFQVISCIFSENAGWILGFLAKTPSYNNCYWQKCRVTLSAFNSVKPIQKRSGNTRLQWIHGMKLSVLPENSEWNCAFWEYAVFAKICLFRGIQNLLYNFLFKKFWAPTLSISEWCQNNLKNEP